VPLEHDVIRSTAAQDLFPDCNDSAADPHATVTATTWKLANAAARAGIDLENSHRDLRIWSPDASGLGFDPHAP
jgi:hypothetical protein